MRYIKWTFVILFWVIVVGFLHYTLPQRDIVRINGTDVQRINVGWNAMFYANRMRTADGNLVGTDVRFINTVNANGRVRVYRNEDTGFWPPYLKFDSADLHTEAADLVSTEADPRWVAVRHYGWRSNFLTIFPNAVSITPVEGPDVRLIPWFNIVFLTLLFAFFWGVWRRWQRFRKARIEPMIEEAEERWDEIDAKSDAARGRISKWWDWVTGGGR